MRRRYPADAIPAPSDRLTRPIPVEADRTLAKRLGRDPRDIVEAAEGLWGRSLTEERDRRVSELGDLPIRDRQERQGHITRELSAALRQWIEREKTPVAEVYDRWHKSRPGKDDKPCREHSSKTRKLVPSGDHGKGKRWQVRWRDGSQVLAPSTLEVTYAYLVRPLKTAVRDRIIASNPCDGVRLPRQRKAEVVPLHKDAVRALIDVAAPHSAPCTCSPLPRGSGKESCSASKSTVSTSCGAR